MKKSIASKPIQRILRILVFSLALWTSAASLSWARAANPQAEQIKAGWRGISAPLLMAYVNELCAGKYAGRLTGTKEYDASAAWLAGRLASWGLRPGGDGGTWFQDFPIPYTLVLPGAELALQVPGANGGAEKKPYAIETDFFPGSTSGSGEVTAEVVYVGYGITAPELGFDEYAGVDVRGKIVLIEVEVPADPGRKPKEFAKWRPYSFHQYKMGNARAHGAAGVLYHYPIVNPNCSYSADLLWTAVGDKVVRDIFAGSGRDHARAMRAIRKKRRPQSFATGKNVTIRNVSEHHAEGIGRNVIALLEGSDPALKSEVIMVSAHLDHLGVNPAIMPGANDNASGVAVAMAVAEALAKLPPPPGTPLSISSELGAVPGPRCARTVAFVFFGAEEQGVIGSEYFLQHRPPALRNVKALINLDGVGRGSKIYALAAKNYPALWKHFDLANRTLVCAKVGGEYFHNRARPRLDAAHFMRAGIPSLSFAAGDAPELPYPVYHTANDKPGILTPAIMVDLSRLLFAALVSLAACR